MKTNNQQSLNRWIKPGSSRPRAGTLSAIARTFVFAVVVGAILIAPEVYSFFPGWIWVLRVLWWSAAGTAVLATLIYIRKGIRYIEEQEQENL